jgi:hypothetical protein
MRDDRVNCENLQRAMREGRELTQAELAHINECDACADASMDAWLTAALDRKPEVAIPVDFAARVAAGLPPRPPRHETARSVICAMVVALVVLVLCFAGRNPASSWVGVVFVMLVASEIAGFALWLGPRWLGR